MKSQIPTTKTEVKDEKKPKSKLAKLAVFVTMWLVPLTEPGVLVEKGKHYVKS